MPEEQQQPPQEPGWVPPSAPPAGEPPAYPAPPPYPAYAAYPAYPPDRAPTSQSFLQAGYAAGAPYQPYGPPQVQPLRGLAIGTAVVSSVLALVQLAAWATSWSAAAELVHMSRSGTDVLDGPLFAYDIVNLGLIPAFIASYVVGCLWLQRARSNAERISPGWPHARSRVWVWLGWWVPIVSFWFPYQVVRDVRAGSPGHARTSGGVGAWWTFYLLFLLTWRVAGATVPISGVPDADLARLLPWVESVATVAMLVCLVLWLRLVREITTAQANAARGA